jgi:hypothetical protein
MQIKGNDMDKMKRFISNDFGDLWIDNLHNKGRAIIFQGKFSCDDENKSQIRNMEE